MIMKKTFLYLLTAITLLTSCDDTTGNIGMLLTNVTDDVSSTISAAEFNISSKSNDIGRVVSRTSNGYIGKIKDPETGAYVTCSFMTQLRSMGTAYQFPAIETLNIKGFDYTQPIASQLDKIQADSCELLVYYPKYYGDPNALINVIAHELAVPYDEGNTEQLYADFDPTKVNGMIRQDTIKAGNDTVAYSIHEPISFSAYDYGLSADKQNNSDYTPYFAVSLNKSNKPYWKDGKRYNNFGSYLMQRFYDPATSKYFNNQISFHKHICPGFYIETVGGLGSMANIAVTQLIVHFHKNVNDKEEVMTTSFAGTEEVMQRTTFVKDTEKINNLINEANSSDYTYLKSPASIMTELTIPIEEILYNHEEDTISTARIFIPRRNNDKQTSYTLQTPSTLLLLPTDSIENFFKEKKVSDGKTSYICAFDKKYNGYVFDNVSKLITTMGKSHSDYLNEVYTFVNNAIASDGLSLDNMEENKKVKILKKYFKRFQQETGKTSPFKFSLIPVETTYTTVSSTSILSKVTYDMSLSSTRLQRGTDELDADGNPIDSPIKISVIYTIDE